MLRRQEPNGIVKTSFSTATLIKILQHKSAEGKPKEVDEKPEKEEDKSAEGKPKEVDEKPEKEEDKSAEAKPEEVDEKPKEEKNRIINNEETFSKALPAQEAAFGKN